MAVTCGWHSNYPMALGDFYAEKTNAFLQQAQSDAEYGNHASTY